MNLIWSWRRQAGSLTILKLAALLVTDALNRKESCGAHFREEFQTADGEAKRNDDEFTYVAAWEFAGEDKPPILHKEELKFEDVEMESQEL